MKPRAFVAMPFGTQSGIDFNAVYEKLIQPALKNADLAVLRADGETRAGDIRTDMFQELLIADLVLADLTIANPNVWYELGVRHALRARGVVLIYGAGADKPFDVYTDRKLRYSFKDGVPGENDVAALTQMVRSTMQSWVGRKVSPVYELLPNLQEPDWKTLRIGNVHEFWAAYEAWHERIERARRQDQVGDVLVLADEAPVAAFRADAWINAGTALCQNQRFAFALEQFDRGLAIEPKNLSALQKKGVCLQRLTLAGANHDGLEDPHDHYRKVLKEYPNDSETYALLGRVDKDRWIAGWRKPGSDEQQMRQRARDKQALLRAAIESYSNGYQRNPGHFYSGINALTLLHLQRHLSGDTHADSELDAMAGAVRFAARCEVTRRKEQMDTDPLFWAYATLGDLEVLIGTPQTVADAYDKATCVAHKSWFALDSCRAQLLILKDLGFNPDNVAAGLTILEHELHQLIQPEKSWSPRTVLLFSGHMVDVAGREPPRFPKENEASAAREIARVLAELGAGPDDLALTQGACGGDLLFSKACLERGVKLHWLQPFREPEFIARSVVSVDGSWRTRYHEARGKVASLRCAPDALGQPPRSAEEGYPYRRCNLWLLNTALAYGIEKVRFICLWNGQDGDGPGGTAHMYEEVKRRTGQVWWIDTRHLNAS